MKTQNSKQSVLSAKKVVFSKGSLQPLTYKPDFNLDFVERLLGRRQRNEVSRITGKRLTIQQNRLQELISPRVIWKDLSIARTDKTGVTLDSGTHLKS